MTSPASNPHLKKFACAFGVLFVALLVVPLWGQYGSTFLNQDAYQNLPDYSVLPGAGPGGALHPAMIQPVDASATQRAMPPLQAEMSKRMALANHARGVRQYWRQRSSS